ncbi:RodZ domain-containing protein [Paenibacillus sp. KS-LC4]|uniref:helix-turn-helix domain-containing protein n=1 Tax=Paenibacillus sp. KS-LC4 TaxID=2979727 RepID=UPI0030CDF72B
MSNLGALLRKAREERGLTLDDIQETTKIRKRYLEAIETGDHSVLPGSFYLRAFVKNYCEAVGLDTEEVLRLHEKEVPNTITETFTEPVTTRPPRRVQSVGSDRIGKLGFNVMMWSFLILIVAVVWIFVINQKDKPSDMIDQGTKITDESAPPTPTPETGATTGAVAPTVTPTPTPTLQEDVTVTFSSKIGKVDHYDVGPGTAVHKLEIKVAGGKSWMEVREGGSKGSALLSENANDGSTLQFELKQPLYINVGRADLVTISVDGVLVPDGDRAGSKKIQLNPAASANAGSPEATVSATP